MMGPADFDLDGAITRAFQRMLEEERQRKRDEEIAESRRHNAVVRDFMMRLIDEVGQGVYEALKVEVQYVPHFGVRELDDAVAHFTYEGQPWAIQSSREGLWWRVQHGTGAGNLPRLLWCTTGPFRDRLLTFLGLVRAYAAQERAEQARRAGEHGEHKAVRTQQEVYLAAQAAQCTREEEERQAQQAELERRKAKAQAEVEQAVAIAQSNGTLFRWPEGRTLTLYRWRWCVAPAQGGGSAEYDEGWSSEDRLTAEGYVTLHQWAATRRLRLLPEAHLPMVEAQTFASPDDLPVELRHTMTITVPVSEPYVVRHAVDEEVEVTSLDVEVGEEPVEWVKDLLT
jgi:hypothetical protein